jgi:hypothetical protein
MNQSQTPMRRTWALLIAGPLLFLAAIVAVSIFYGIAPRGDAQAIAEQTPKAMPVVLLVVQLVLSPCGQSACPGPGSAGVSEKVTGSGGKRCWGLSPAQCWPCSTSPHSPRR